MDFLTAPPFLANLPAWGQTLAGVAALIVAAALANVAVKRVILGIVDHGLAGQPAGALLEPVARRLANIVPAVIVSQGIRLVPHLPAEAIALVRNVAMALIVLAVVLAISAGLNAVNALYQSRPDAASRPIKGYIQVVKILLFGTGAILGIAVLMEQSPLLLLSGLAAMAAVLMLVFKDTILSLVASVQLTSNDMLRVGDWIDAPQFDANGDVVDIALDTVKGQNFDKTITTIPTCRLISESFRNWRGMAEAGARRIMRSLHIDQNSARFLTSEQKAKLVRFAQLGNYIETKRQEIAQWNAELARHGEDPVNHRELTNIGTFRAYVQAYVEGHPPIHHGMTQLVRQLAPSPEGLPIEIYCFADTVTWSEYEAIQADIFDHLLAVLPRFGLRLYQRPGGVDLRAFSRASDRVDGGRLCQCQTS